MIKTVSAAPANEEVVYFSMAAPAWFMEKPLDEKCGIVENLAKDLQAEIPIAQQQWDELVSNN